MADQLGHFADLRSGGNLPTPRRFPAIRAAITAAIAAGLLITLFKAAGHHAALACGAC